MQKHRATGIHSWHTGLSICAVKHFQKYMPYRRFVQDIHKILFVHLWSKYIYSEPSMDQSLFCIKRAHGEINLENADLNKVKNIINSLSTELLQAYNKLSRSQNHKEEITICYRQNEHIIWGCLLLRRQNNQWRYWQGNLCLFINSVKFNSTRIYREPTNAGHKQDM